MIIGPCPYCDEMLFNPICDEPPAFERKACEACGNIYWLKHSRIDAYTMTDEDFRKEFDVDDETKTIKEKKK